MADSPESNQLGPSLGLHQQEILLMRDVTVHSAHEKLVSSKD